jgi:predicted transcriptional regulator
LKNKYLAFFNIFVGTLQPKLYGSDQALTQVVKNRILRKNEAMEKCLERVVQELRLFLSEIVQEVVARNYRSFAVKVKDTLYNQLNGISEHCEHLLKQILQEEASYINSKHVDFFNM